MRRLALATVLVAAAVTAGCTIDDQDRSRARVYDDGLAYLPGAGYGGTSYGYAAPGYGYPGPLYGYGGVPYAYGSPGYRYDHRGDHDEPGAPWHGDDRRFDRQGHEVVCDRLTKVCYKKGDIDASETRDRFGNHAGRRVDGIQDRNRTNDVFLPRPGVICNDQVNVCKTGGEPNRKLTRDYFGNQAARRVGQDPGQRTQSPPWGNRAGTGISQNRASPSGGQSRPGNAGAGNRSGYGNGSRDASGQWLLRQSRQGS